MHTGRFFYLHLEFHVLGPEIKPILNTFPSLSPSHHEPLWVFATPLKRFSFRCVLLRVHFKSNWNLKGFSEPDLSFCTNQTEQDFKPESFWMLPVSKPGVKRGCDKYSSSLGFSVSGERTHPTCYKDLKLWNFPLRNIPLHFRMPW